MIVVCAWHPAGPEPRRLHACLLARSVAIMLYSIIHILCLLVPSCCLAACMRSMRRAARHLGRCAGGSPRARVQRQQRERLPSVACSASAWDTQRVRWRTWPNSRAGAFARRHRSAVAADAAPSQARVGRVPRRRQSGDAARRWRGRLHMEPRRRGRAGVRSSRALRESATLRRRRRSAAGLDALCRATHVVTCVPPVADFDRDPVRCFSDSVARNARTAEARCLHASLSGACHAPSALA